MACSVLLRTSVGLASRVATRARPGSRVRVALRSRREVTAGIGPSPLRSSVRRSWRGRGIVRHGEWRRSSKSTLQVRHHRRARSMETRTNSTAPAPSSQRPSCSPSKGWLARTCSRMTAAGAALDLTLARAGRTGRRTDWVLQGECNSRRGSDLRRRASKWYILVRLSDRWEDRPGRSGLGVRSMGGDRVAKAKVGR